MKEQLPVNALTHRDLLYEAMVLVMEKMTITVEKDQRFLALYGEFKDRLEKSEEICTKCREKVNMSEMAEA